VRQRRGGGGVWEEGWCCRTADAVVVINEVGKDHQWGKPGRIAAGEGGQGRSDAGRGEAWVVDSNKIKKGIGC
jgi:hypothetical protein